MRKYRFAGIAAAVLLAFSGTVSAPFSETPFSVSAEAASKLGAPTGFRASVSGNTVKLRWNKVSGADAYRVYRYDPRTGSWKSTAAAKKNTVTINGLDSGTYKFRVAALVKQNTKYSAQTRSKTVTVKIAAEEEKITDLITVNAQSSIRIDCKELILRIDPYLISGEPHDADIVLLTHEHYDHFSPEDLKKVMKSDTAVAAPATMKKALADAGIKDPILLAPDKKTEIRGIPIETVRAYNLSKSYHPKASNWLGYIVTVLGKRVYAAGDTDATPEAGKVKCDAALVPIGGTYTMDAKEAAGLINSIKPEYAIPLHYGAVVGDSSDAERFAGLVDKSITVEIKIQV